MNSLKQFVNSGVAGKAAKGQAIVFVHGIFSSHKTFDPLRLALLEMGLSAQIQHYYHDYNFNLPLERNGRILAADLRAAFRESSAEVTIIAHSMGGLVSRLALLQDITPHDRIKRLIMLGTPNYGCLQTGQLGLYAHFVREAIGAVWAITAGGRAGIKELTETQKVFAPLLRDSNIKRTLDIDYVTIPGLFYREDAGVLRKGGSVGMRLPVVMAKFSEALTCGAVPMSLPHDGIVEERSVYLGRETMLTRRSERRGRMGERYVHVGHIDHHDADHVAIQTTRRSAEIIVELFKLPSLEAWRQQAEQNYDYNLRPD